MNSKLFFDSFYKDEHSSHYDYSEQGQGLELELEQNQKQGFETVIEMTTI